MFKNLKINANLELSIFHQTFFFLEHLFLAFISSKNISKINVKKTSNLSVNLDLSILSKPFFLDFISKRHLSLRLYVSKIKS